MKPLNRPMFRYGGPIKQGIMSGIKEPRQNYNQAGSVQPKNQYKFSETPIAKAASVFANYGPNAAIAGIYDLGAVPINTAARMFGYNPGFSGTKFVLILRLYTSCLIVLLSRFFNTRHNSLFNGAAVSKHWSV